MPLLLYFIALLPMAVGGYLWVTDYKVNLLEWLLGSVIGIFIAGGFHYFAFYQMVSDWQTLSGHVTETFYSPRWVERSTVVRQRGNHYVTETEHQTHPEYWEACLELGSALPSRLIEPANSKTDKKAPTFSHIASVRIAKTEYQQIAKEFGKIEKRRGTKSNYYSGDPYIYIAVNKKNVCIPVTQQKLFYNRIKAAPSLFSYRQISDTISVFPYPENKNLLASDRLLGTAGEMLNIRLWDEMNSRLGPNSKVNVILVGFGNQPSSIAHDQEAKWIGGKKNDLVLCYGGINPHHAAWSYVFGWTEENIVKRNLETLLLTQPIDKNMIPLIEAEIVQNYQIKKWSKFDYITITLPWWTYLSLFLTMVVYTTAYGFWIHRNRFYKAAR